MESKRQLTREELLEMESAPKTKMQHMLDVVICFCPYFAAIIMFLVYYLMPDAVQNFNPHVFTIVVCFFLALYLIMVVRGLLNKSYFAKVRHKAPLYSVIILVIMLYDFLTVKTGILKQPFFPCVNTILCAIIDDRALLLKSTLYSLRLLFTGYFIGAILGLITGVACGYSKRINYWVSPIIKMLGPIPSTTWIPIIMVLVSSLFKGSVFIIALGVWFALTIASSTGIQNVDKAYLEAARTLGAKGHQLVFRVAIPHAMPNILQGMTQGMSSACTALLVAEMMGAEAGLGWYIQWQKSWAIYSKMYAAIVFAIMAEMAVETENDVFHIVFMIVLFSILLQGSLLPLVAKKLDMIDEKGDVMKTFNDYSDEVPVQFIQLSIPKSHHWCGKTLKELTLPPETLVVLLKRNGENIIPNGDTRLLENDVLVLSATSPDHVEGVSLVEIYVDENSKYNGKLLSEIPKKENTLVIMIQRGEQVIIPHGNIRLESGDMLVVSKTEI